MNSRTLTRRSLGLVLVAGLGVSLAACGDDGADAGANGGKVTITVNGQPPKTQPFERKIFDEDVAEFERTHENIDIEPREGFMDPKTFNSKLAGGQLEDVFYVYLTDPANLIARRQAADISAYVKDVPHYDELQPAQGAGGLLRHGRQRPQHDGAARARRGQLDHAHLLGGGVVVEVEAQPVAVEGDRAVDVADRQGDDLQGPARHRAPTSPSRRS